MTLHIDVPEDVAARLAAEAEAHGLAVEEYVRRVLQHAVAAPRREQDA